MSSIYRKVASIHMGRDASIEPKKIVATREPISHTIFARFINDGVTSMRLCCMIVLPDLIIGTGDPHGQEKMRKLQFEN